MAGYHIHINGVGYLLAPGSYERGYGSEPVEPKRWRATDWRMGDGHLAGVGGRGSGDGGFRSGFGVDIGEPGRLSLGSAVGVSDATTEDGLAGFCSYGGKLYGVSRSSGRVLCWDGGAWSNPYTAPATLRCIGQGYGELMVGAADGKVYSYDPFAGTWGERFTVGTGEVTAVVETVVNEPVTGGFSVEPRVVFGLSRASGSGQLKAVSADGVTTLSMDVGESRIEAMALYRGKLYLAVSWGAVASGGRLLCYGMRGGGSFWDLSEIAVMSDAAPVSLCVADGILWIGRSDGRVMAWDGTRVTEALDLAARGVEDPGELRGLANRGERVYVGYEHPVQGASLLCRQPAAVSGAGPGLSGCRDGWVMECGSGVAGGVSALGVYGGTVFFARDAAGAATVYERRLDAIRPSGEMVLSVFDGGEPEVSKVLRGCWVLFEPLRDGESVRLSYSLDGSTWTLLAAPVTAGLTSAHCGFPPGSARRVWLKVELSSAAADLGPALTGVVLEYSDCVDAKRRWKFDVRCEGVAGVPLRLLDGLVEALSGAQLSGSLWDALSENIVSFDDLDGYGYTVWFRSLKEDVGKLPQAAGVQTVATVELVEC